MNRSIIILNEAFVNDISGYSEWCRQEDRNEGSQHRTLGYRRIFRISMGRKTIVIVLNEWIYLFLLLNSFLYFLLIKSALLNYFKNLVECRAINYIKRIDNVSFTLAHLLSVFISHDLMQVHVLERWLLHHKDTHHAHSSDPEKQNVGSSLQ